MQQYNFRRATQLLTEQAIHDLPYDLQQWLVEQPGLMVQEDDIVKAFADTPPSRLHNVIQTMVQASVLLPIGNGVYYKNMRTIEARGLPQG